MSEVQLWATECESGAARFDKPRNLQGLIASMNSGEDAPRQRLCACLLNRLAMQFDDQLLDY